MKHQQLQSPSVQDNSTGKDATIIASELSRRFAAPVKQVYVLDINGQKHTMVDVCNALGVRQDEDTPVALNFCGSWKLPNGETYDVNLSQAARLNGIHVSQSQLEQTRATSAGASEALTA